MAKYINPYTDFGFKKLFGEEGSKELLVDFLNQLLPPHHQIANLNFSNSEILPESEEDRKAFFDIHCIATSGERFIVEMQKAKVKHFKDRALFYTTFPIKEQAKKGDWNFELSAIYFIAILDFFYDEKQEEAKFRRDVMLKDQDCEIFYDKLHFKFLQMPAFTKREFELETHFDKWAYFLKHLENFDDIPKILNEPIFENAFKIAELAKFSSDQRLEYEKSRMTYLGVKAVADTAEEQGEAKGFVKGEAKGKIEGKAEGLVEGEAKGIEKGLVEGEVKGVTKVAKSMKQKGVPFDEIEEFTGLSIEEIEKL